MKTKEQKKKEAIARNSKWEKLTPEQKLNYLNENKLRASRQRIKLGHYEGSDKNPKNRKAIIPEDCVY